MGKQSMKAKSGVGEYEAFSNALRRVLRVSHTELKARLMAEQASKKRKPKASASDRASSDKK